MHATLCSICSRPSRLRSAALAARVADHAGAAARQRDRCVAEALQARQRDQRDGVADVQAVGRGVEAVVDGDLFLRQQLRHASDRSKTRPRHFSSSNALFAILLLQG